MEILFTPTPIVKRQPKSESAAHSAQPAAEPTAPAKLTVVEHCARDIRRKPARAA